MLSSVYAEQTLQELGGIPIDRVAWRVLGKGEHYERPLHLRLLCFDESPPIIDRRHNHHAHREVTTRDFSGIRFGRLTVIGYWGRRYNGPSRKKYRLKNGTWQLYGSNQSKTKGLVDQLWVCRCLCGLFTIRSAKSISIALPESMCNACNHLEREKWLKEHKRKTE